MSGRSGGRDEQAPADFALSYPRLLRLANTCAPAGVDGADLLQEVLTRVLRRHPNLEGIENLEHYLARAVVNSGRNARRNLFRRSSAVGPDPSLRTAGPSGEDDPDEVGRLLAIVPARQRAILYLRFVEDRSVKDVADLLGCSEGNVKAQTSRGLVNLRRALDREQVADVD